ncbi:MAG: hypothetical protein RIQ78_1229, partial [Bacteroidota bacterium]
MIRQISIFFQNITSYNKQLNITIYNKMEKPWLQHYPAGVPANIDPNAYSSVVDMLEECFNRFSDRPAYYFMG